MKKFALSVLFLALIIVAFFYPAQSNKRFEIRGSIPYWDQQNAIKSFKENIEIFSAVNLFWFYLDTNGRIRKYKFANIDEGFIEFAKENKIRVSALIANLPENGDWDSERVEKVIESPQSRTKHIQDIIKLLEQYNLDGVSIDYESVDGDQRNNFSDFIKELSYQMKNKNKFVGVALHPKTSQNSQYEFQDWKTLSKYADELYIMAYGEHYDKGHPGPIASLPWTQEIINYAKSQNLPLNKFLLGVPLYGYDWGEDDNTAIGLTYSEIKDLLNEQDEDEVWDEDAASPHFNYEDEDDEDHEVWYENAESVEHKAKLAKESGMGGVTFWRLGGEDSEIWNHLKNLLISP